MDWVFEMYDYYISMKNRCYYLSLLKKGDEWHIHGLWPQFDANTYPSYCKPVTFDINKLFSILPALEKYWYSDEKEKNQKFWSHEWTKHGSCMFTKMDELEYFQTALKLYGEAVKLNLPEKFYKDGKCLIPIDLNLKFMDCSLNKLL